MDFLASLFVVAVGYFGVALFGGMLIAPTGPGSDRILYVCLLVYSLLVAVFRSGLTRVISLLLAALFLTGVISETKARRDFHQHLREQQHLKEQHQTEEAGH